MYQELYLRKYEFVLKINWKDIKDLYSIIFHCQIFNYKAVHCVKYLSSNMICLRVSSEVAENVVSLCCLCMHTHTHTHTHTQSPNVSFSRSNDRGSALNRMLTLK